MSYVRTFIEEAGVRRLEDLDDGAKADDKTYEDHGVKVFVDGKSDLYLAGVTIDWKESLMGASFTFDNPNSEGSCGCGESFYA